MKYAAVALFAAGAFAASADTTAAATDAATDAAITQAPAPTQSLTKQQKCVKDSCDVNKPESYANCQASCYSVPYPNSAQAEQNVECAETCVSQWQTKNTSSYASCIQACAYTHFFNPTKDVNGGGAAPAKPTGGSGSGSGSEESGAAGETGAAATGTEAEATGTEAAATTTATGAAGKFAYSLSGVVGAVGIVALAL